MPQGIIHIEGLSFTYPGSGCPVLKNVDLEVEKGDFVAVIGSNGSGKTTLCKAMNGLIPQYISGDFAGKVEVNGLNTLETTVASLARHIAYVYQDFENQLVRSTVYEDVIFAPLNFGFADYRERGLQALKILGLEHLKDRFIWELSGGQKHLAAMAGALSLGPDIIIVDEPAAQLDPLTAVRVYEKLQILNRDYGKTIIVIEHNSEFIADYCRSVIMMDGGCVFWQKPVREALNRIDELKERNIHPPQVTQAAHLLFQSGSGKNNVGNYPIQIAESEAYFAGINLKPSCCAHSITEPSPANNREPVITFQGASYGYKTLENTTHYVLSNVDFTIYEGDRLAIVGSNGAGKSTLLKLISGIIKPQSGGVTVYDSNTRDASPENLAEIVTYIFQHPEEMFIEDSIRRDIEYFLKVRKNPNLEVLVDQVVNGLQLTELQNQNGRLLSGGQQRRASLAIGVATHPSVILLDEPTGSLDISSRKEMVAMLEYLKDRVKTVIVATHDMQLAAEWANRIAVMKDGKIIEDSDKYRVFGNPALLKEANLRPPQIVELCHDLGISPVAFSLGEFSNRLVLGKEDHHGKYYETVE
ncbi:MAG: cobalt ABC transporter ATP-binding protein [Gracilibacter sp. BRH_c7a]|nr:MAG: cobalt ABC transporter ATP-binding protein [Gracilibacter sp. BRH_c7a]